MNTNETTTDVAREAEQKPADGQGGQVMNAETPEQLRASAAAHDQAAQESFERCDTDGFLSQWAHQLAAQRDEIAAQIAENGGMWEFPALFNLDGTRAHAKLVRVANKFSYGRKRPVWLVADAQGNAIAWISAFPMRESTMRRKGYIEGTEMAPAGARINGEGHGLSGHAWAEAYRKDDGFGVAGSRMEVK